MNFCWRMMFLHAPICALFQISWTALTKDFASQTKVGKDKLIQET